MYELFVVSDGVREQYYPESPPAIYAFLYSVIEKSWDPAERQPSLLEMAAERGWHAQDLGPMAVAKPEYRGYHVICFSKADAALIKMFFDVEPRRILR